MSVRIEVKETIYLVVGVPGSGKSWICEQLKDRFTYCHHDGYIGHIAHPEAYVDGILEAAKETEKPILAEAPFSVSAIKNPLEWHGHRVVPLYIIEDPSVVAARYQKREGKPIPKGHLTRMNTYAQRAKATKAFHGTSREVFERLVDVADGKLRASA